MTTEFDMRDEVAMRGTIVGIRVDLRNATLYRIKLKDADGNIGYIETPEDNLILIKKYEEE